MKTSNHKLSPHIIIPLIVLAVLLMYLLVIWLFDLPGSEEVIEMAKSYYQEHAYTTTFIAALAEGFLFLNWYLPGSIVLAFGVVFASQSSLDPVIIVGLIMIGFFITAVINYWLGKYGFYKLFLKLGLKKSLDKMHVKVEKYGLPIILSSYFHPNVGALAATSAGILKLSFAKFILYSALSILFWNSIFGVIVYYSGEGVLQILSTKGMIVIMSIWLVIALILYLKNYKNERKTNSKRTS